MIFISNIQIVERDYVILNEITRWRFLLSRQIRLLAKFNSQSACDRRLKKLMNAGYLTRKKYIYGVPYLYFCTAKAKRVFSLEYITKDIRIEQILHEIAVVDTAIYLINKNNIDKKTIVTEREIKHKNGFGNPKHKPDFIFKEKDKIYCVEIEMSVKKKDTLSKNVKENYLDYDKQIWYVDSSKIKITNYLEEFKKSYSNMEIYNIQEVQLYVKKL